MRKIAKNIVVFAILALTAYNAAASDKTYYVSAETGGSARSADGSQAKPWKDLQVALDKVEEGSTILIAQGNYLGTSERGYLEMLKPVNLKGGYSPDFSKRDVLAYRTLIQPTAKANGTSGSFALLNLGKKGTTNGLKPAGELVIDGLILDRGFSNAYSPNKGKPEGVEAGMLLNTPSRGENNGIKDVVTLQQPLLWFDLAGKMTIQNCVFTNGGNYAIMGNALGADIKIKNNLFINNTYAAVQIVSRLPTGNYGNTVDFGYNTVLFNWSRTDENVDMGYGYRFMTGVNSDVHHSIIGLSTLGGLDRTRVESKPADEAKRQTGVEDNYFFLNKQGDLVLPSGGGKWTLVWAKEFEDREELYKYERNEELGDNAEGFKGKLNEAFLTGFLNFAYTETTDYDANSPANEFRRYLGMNQMAKITSKVSMFANRYPLEDTVKLFGAVSGKGAQIIEN